jgi:hypothetical protein
VPYKHDGTLGDAILNRFIAGRGVQTKSGGFVEGLQSVELVCGLIMKRKGRSH